MDWSGYLNISRLIREDHAYHKDKAHGSNPSNRNPSQSVTYPVLPLRHTILCDIDNTTLEYTQPEPLVHGTNHPFKTTIKLLLVALLYTTYPKTPIHYLLVDLQDMIIDSVSRLLLMEAGTDGIELSVCNTPRCVRGRKRVFTYENLAAQPLMKMRV